MGVADAWASLATLTNPKTAALRPWPHMTERDGGRKTDGDGTMTTMMSPIGPIGKREQEGERTMATEWQQPEHGRGNTSSPELVTPASSGLETRCRGVDNAREAESHPWVGLPATVGSQVMVAARWSYHSGAMALKALS